VKAPLALGLHGEGRAEESPLPGEGLAQGVGHLPPNVLIEVGQASVNVVQEAIDVHPQRSTGVSVPPGRAYNRSGETATTRERILFVCTANIDRSRTAADLYASDARYEVRSAGVAPYAAQPVTRDLLLWADRVFVLNESEDQHRTIIQFRFPDVDRPIIDLDIEDRWRRGHPELISLLQRRLRPHMGAPMSVRDEAECREEG
jgi:predicted protein tyrosine phosphatase